MYAKISGNTAVKFPYSFGDLRKDNPNVSFPKNISTATMNKYNMVAVREGTKPTPSATQRVQQNALPTRPVTGQDDDGNDILASYWEIGYSLVDLSQDEIASKNTDTAANNRARRDSLLQETDHYGLSDVAMSQEMLDYREALRDLPHHDNWPHLNDSDWPTKP